MRSSECPSSCECFAIDTAHHFIRKRQDRFINKFCASDNLVCRVKAGID